MNQHRILPPAPRRGSNIQVVIEEEMQGLFPVTVTAVPVVQPGINRNDIVAAEVIANTLRRAVRTRVEVYKTWHFNTALSRTRGVLFMENWNNEGHRSARQNVLLRNLTGELLWDMFEHVPSLTNF